MLDQVRPRALSCSRQLIEIVKTVSTVWDQRMSNAKAIELLAETALFGGLGEADLAHVADELRERSFDAGQQIFARGDPGSEVYFVLSGRVRLSVQSIEGRELSFGHANRGAVFGEIAVLDGGARTADATALVKVRALTLSRSALLRLVREHPEVAAAAVELLCSRLRTTSDQLEGVVLNPIHVRLARFLLYTIRMERKDVSSGRATITVDMPQHELGLLIGASRQTVNQEINALKRKGAIKRVGKLFDCDVARLRKIVDAHA